MAALPSLLLAWKGFGFKIRKIMRRMMKTRIASRMLVMKNNNLDDDANLSNPQVKRFGR